jgi:hypothetical protein
MGRTQKRVLQVFVALALVLVAVEILPLASSALVPFGANVTEFSTSIPIADNATYHDALAGNVTGINVMGYTTTETWQGYFGNVSGTIQLADSNDYVMYNWTQISPRGEIYASTNSTITWTNVMCFNYTAIASGAAETGIGTSGPGGTEAFGTNLTGLEAQYGINSSDVDGVNETFNFGGGLPGGHHLFYTASRLFTEGECPTTQVYANTGPVAAKFTEVLLYEPVTTSVIFTSLLENDMIGFDTATHDFELMVLDNGHGTDTSTTRYYFFVEIE